MYLSKGQLPFGGSQNGNCCIPMVRHSPLVEAAKQDLLVPTTELSHSTCCNMSELQKITKNKYKNKYKYKCQWLSCLTQLAVIRVSWKKYQIQIQIQVPTAELSHWTTWFAKNPSTNQWVMIIRLFPSFAFLCQSTKTTLGGVFHCDLNVSVVWNIKRWQWKGLVGDKRWIGWVKSLIWTMGRL